MADEIHEVITREEFVRFKKAVIAKLKKQEDLISDLFVRITNVEDKEDGLVDDAVERATRAQRAVRRLEKRVLALEAGSEGD